MRWFLIPAVATVALVLADSAPAKAQIIIRGTPTYTPPYTVRYYTPYPVVAAPTIPSSFVPNFNGGVVDYALDSSLRTLGWTGFGPYAGYANFANPGYYSNLVNPASYAPWNGYRNFTAPNLKSFNPVSPKGFFKGGKGR